MSHADGCALCLDGALEKVHGLEWTPGGKAQNFRLPENKSSELAMSISLVQLIQMVAKLTNDMAGLMAKANTTMELL